MWYLCVCERRMAVGIQVYSQYNETVGTGNEGYYFGMHLKLRHFSIYKCAFSILHITPSLWIFSLAEPFLDLVCSYRSGVIVFVQFLIFTKYKLHKHTHTIYF